MENENILELEKQKVDKLLSMNYLTPENAVFTKTEGGFAALEYGGETYQRVNFHRTFPFTSPDSFISVRLPGEKAEEIGIIENLSVFDEETVRIISDQLKLRYFMPKITKIHSIKEEYGFAYWVVTTDCGECKFTMHTGSGSTAKIGENRLIIKDIDENRYEIEDMSTLSQKEFKKLDLYI